MKPLKNLDADELAEELCASNPDLQFPVSLAAALHEGQTRRAPRGGQQRLPYIEHPLRVAIRLARLGAVDYHLLTSAILHDVVEDCSEKIADTPAGAIRALEWQFGCTVSSTVDWLTLPRGVKYLDHASEAVSSDPRALLIKISDWIDNAGSLHHLDDVPPRLLRKYLPMTEVFLDALDQSHHAADHLLEGSSEKLRQKVVQVGDRLVDLSRSPRPGQSAAHAGQLSAPVLSSL